MKIGFFGVEEWEKEVLKKAFPKDKLVFSKDSLSLKKVSGHKEYKELEAIGIFIHSKITDKLLEELPRLRLITTMSTGFDHINLDSCRKRGITVSNVPAYGENTVAEHTFGLILALSRKLVECVERTRRGSFELSGLRGFDLQGKILGVVGCGNIGKHVIRIAKGFEMKVVVFDLYKDRKLAREMGFRYAPLEKLLRESDIVTLHVPLNKHTFHLIDEKRIKLMKKGALLINTSRGGIVDTEALVKGLKSRKLRGAGLDVLEEECELKEEKELLGKGFAKKWNLKTLIENHILLERGNVLITPHNAFNTKEALLRILEVTVENIRGFRKGKRVNRIAVSGKR